MYMVANRTSGNAWLLARNVLPMHLSVYAFVLEGYKLDDAPTRLGIRAIKNFAWEDENEKRIQACVLPVWDMALTSIRFCDAVQ
ncbi:hypothetical protein AJ79_03748 [Helicocarpus griseus UAMH5409]|uniref:Uncharacterized protein n=1 Tax=Helicocarpus griseus UAMH5409 TaxID=1447875 RepID=A0A2B7XX34_9EURO|nr:hypothetical protein AJ79_03748 [Helicocarpus griseus UAMH5409]